MKWVWRGSLRENLARQANRKLRVKANHHPFGVVAQHKDPQRLRTLHRERKKVEEKDK
jgi:hypothetical protein